LLLKFHVNIEQYGTEYSHHLQASHLTSKANKTTRATALEYILASGLDRPNEEYSQNQASHDSTRDIRIQETQEMGSSGVWSGYEGKENGNGCRRLTN
jgi:hypothetical protein